MNTVGIFAGRGDTILAMGLAFIVGMWVGWKLCSLWKKFRNK
jgi:hypothetical protein